MTPDEARARLVRREFSLELAVCVLTRWHEFPESAHRHDVATWLYNRVRQLEAHAAHPHTAHHSQLLPPGVDRADVFNLLFQVIPLTHKHARVVTAFLQGGTEAQCLVLEELQRAVARVSADAHALLRKMNP